MSNDEQDKHDMNSNPNGPESLLHFIEANSGAQLNSDLITERTANKILFLEEKLRKADEVLRESAIEIKNLREEREKHKLDNDRLRLQLE